MTKSFICLFALISLLTLADRGIAFDQPNIVLIFGDDKRRIEVERPAA